jgi:hypothetical protein
VVVVVAHCATNSLADELPVVLHDLSLTLRQFWIIADRFAVLTDSRLTTFTDYMCMRRTVVVRVDLDCDTALAHDHSGIARRPAGRGRSVSVLPGLVGAVGCDCNGDYSESNDDHADGTLA